MNGGWGCWGVSLEPREGAGTAPATKLVSGLFCFAGCIEQAEWTALD